MTVVVTVTTFIGFPAGLSCSPPIWLTGDCAIVVLPLVVTVEVVSLCVDPTVVTFFAFV